MGEYNTNQELVEKFTRLLPDAPMADFQMVCFIFSTRLLYSFECHHSTEKII